jgi:hypothetical protein
MSSVTVSEARAAPHEDAIEDDGERSPAVTPTTPPPAEDEGSTELHDDDGPDPELDPSV